MLEETDNRLMFKRKFQTRARLLAYEPTLISGLIFLIVSFQDLDLDS